MLAALLRFRQTAEHPSRLPIRYRSPQADERSQGRGGSENVAPSGSTHYTDFCEGQ